MNNLEKKTVSRVLNAICRNNFLLIGDEAQLPLLEDIRISRATFLNRDITIKYPNTAIQADPERLPIRPESMDVVLCARVIEQNPHRCAVLQEIHRILKPEGKIVVLGDNRWRLSGWQVNAMSRALKKIGFSVDKEKTFCFPFCHPISETLGQLLFPAWGATYMIVAVKNVTPVTPLLSPRFAKPETVQRGY